MISTTMHTAVAAAINASNHSTAIPASSITEAMAIATVLQDTFGHAPTAAQVASFSGVMTNAQVELGYIALVNPSMTAQEVATENIQLTEVGANTAWANAMAPVLTAAQATTQMAHFGETISIPTNLEANAINNMNLEVFGHSSSSMIDGSSAAMSQGMVDIALASTVDPFMPAGEAGRQVIEDTINGDGTAYTSHTAIVLTGVQTSLPTEYHLFG